MRNTLKKKWLNWPIRINPGPRIDQFTSHAQIYVIEKCSYQVREAFIFTSVSKNSKYTYWKLSIRAFLRLFMYTYNTGMKYDLLLCKQSM